MFVPSRATWQELDPAVRALIAIDVSTPDDFILIVSVEDGILQTDVTTKFSKKFSQEAVLKRAAQSVANDIERGDVPANAKIALGGKYLESVFETKTGLLLLGMANLLGETSRPYSPGPIIRDVLDRTDAILRDRNSDFRLERSNLGGHGLSFQLKIRAPFDHLIHPVYLEKDCPPAMIERAAEAGLNFLNTNAHEPASFVTGPLLYAIDAENSAATNLSALLMDKLRTREIRTPSANAFHLAAVSLFDKAAEAGYTISSAPVGWGPYRRFTLVPPKAEHASAPNT